MIVIRFENVREFVKSMNDVSKRIWISADDPQALIYKVVDEHLEYCLEIAMRDFKATGNVLSKEEVDAFRPNGGRWNLVKDVKITEQQKFLLSGHYLTGMANYLTEKYSFLLEKSSLRVNGTFTLSKAELPILPVEPGTKAWCLDENGRDFIEIEDENMCVPIFEVGNHYSKKYDSIWDVKIDDFINNDGILLKENELYTEIRNELGSEVNITLLSRSPLTVLPCSDWVNKEMGFSVFEQIGIGIFEP